jgi:hypothetical protein
MLQRNSALLGLSDPGTEDIGNGGRRIRGLIWQGNDSAGSVERKTPIERITILAW